MMYLCLSKRAPQTQRYVLLGFLFLSTGAGLGCSSSGTKSPTGSGGNQDAAVSSGGSAGSGGLGAGGFAAGGLAAGGITNNSGGSGQGGSGGVASTGGRGSGGQVSNTGGNTGTNGGSNSGGSGGAGGTIGTSAGGTIGTSAGGTIGTSAGGTIGTSAGGTVGTSSGGSTSSGGVTGGTTGLGGAAGGATGGGGSIATNRVRTIQSFNDNWLFNYGDAAGADAATFADSGWRSLSVPHDWAIEGPNPPADPFSQNAPSTGRGAYLPSGIGWYRKHFTLAQSLSGNKVFIEFDGVMANSTVYVNGTQIWNQPCGYTSFRYDITSNVKFRTTDNVIAVKTDTSAQPSSRFYAGAGIYRHVRLIATNPVHIDQWATYVSTPAPTATAATVKVTTSVVNSGSASASVSVQGIVSDPSGKAQAPTGAPWYQVVVTSIVARDRNHPSIALYSTGNEIRDSLATRTPILTKMVWRHDRRHADPARRFRRQLPDGRSRCGHGRLTHEVRRTHRDGH